MKKIFLVILALFILFLSIYLSFNKELKIFDGKSEMEKCNDLKDPVKRDRCYRDVWEKNSDINDCDDIYIDPTYYPEEDQYNNPQDICRQSVSISKSSSEMCEYVKNENMKNDCIGIIDISKNGQICDYYASIPNSTTKDNCLKGVATVLYQESVCNLMEKREAVGSFSFDSVDSCYIGIATLDNRIDLCEKIINSGKKNQCYFNVGSLYDLSVCDLIEKDSEKWSCYISHARGDNNKNTIKEEVCDLIEDQEERDYCIGEIKRIKGR